jgi:hypothetical protein
VFFDGRYLHGEAEWFGGGCYLHGVARLSCTRGGFGAWLLGF